MKIDKYCQDNNNHITSYEDW